MIETATEETKDEKSRQWLDGEIVMQCHNGIESSWLLHAIARKLGLDPDKVIEEEANTGKGKHSHDDLDMFLMQPSSVEKCVHCGKKLKSLGPMFCSEDCALEWVNNTSDEKVKQSGIISLCRTCAIEQNAVLAFEGADTDDNLGKHIVLLAIDEWKKSHDMRVLFYGSFVSFNEEGESTEAVWTCCGNTELIQKDAEALLKKLRKDEEDGFVCW